MKNSGKTLTIFLFVIAILLVSISAISVFFFLTEVDLRKSAEYNLEQLRVIEARLHADLKENQKQISNFEKKSKEDDEKIESLMEDVELEKGLREEIKKENRQLKEDIQKETRTKEDMRQQLQKDITSAEEKIVSMQEKLDSTINRNKELEERRQEIEKQYEQLKQEFEQLGIPPSTEIEGEEQPASEAEETEEKNVELGKIVVGQTSPKKGQVISVDKETNFLIVNLGEKDGVAKGTVLSIYRAEKYLGDVEVSRVLPEMSAADFVLPLKSQLVRKDDQVIIK